MSRELCIAVWDVRVGVQLWEQPTSSPLGLAAGGAPALATVVETSMCTAQFAVVVLLLLVQRVLLLCSPRLLLRGCGLQQMGIDGS